MTLILPLLQTSLQQVTVIKKQQWFQQSDAQYQDLQHPGLLKPSSTASNIPKSSASGLSNGGADPQGLRVCLIQPRTNTRTGILRAQVS